MESIFVVVMRHPYDQCEPRSEVSESQEAIVEIARRWMAEATDSDTVVDIFEVVAGRPKVVEWQPQLGENRRWIVFDHPLLEWLMERFPEERQMFEEIWSWEPKYSTNGYGASARTGINDSVKLFLSRSEATRLKEMMQDPKSDALADDEGDWLRRGTMAARRESAFQLAMLDSVIVDSWAPLFQPGDYLRGRAGDTRVLVLGYSFDDASRYDKPHGYVVMTSHGAVEHRRASDLEETYRRHDNGMRFRRVFADEFVEKV